MTSYGIRNDYIINSNPKHHIDIYWKDEAQDEVYSYAKNICEKNKFETIVDIGCGSGYKLIKYFNELNTIGIETEPCLSFLKKQYPQKTWIESGTQEKSFSDFFQKTDLIICSDVIEHMLNPDILLSYILKFDFKYLIISTPDRNQLAKRLSKFKKISEVGPPENKSHVREWNFDEFYKFINEKFLVEESFHCEKQIECMCFLCKKK